MQEMPLSFFYLLFIFSSDDQILRVSTDTISLPFKKRKLYHAIQPECTKNNDKICPNNQEKSLENKSDIYPSPKKSKDDDHTSNNFRYKLVKRIVIIRSGRLPSKVKFINRQKSVNEKTDKVPDFENTSLSHKRDSSRKEKHNSLENNSQGSDNSFFKGFQDIEIKEKKDHNLHLNQSHELHKYKNSEILFKCLSSKNPNSKIYEKPCCSQPNTFNKHKELFNTEASSGNLDIRNSKIFSLLGDKKDQILNLNLIFKQKFYQKKIEKTKTELFERPFKLPCQINYKKIINRIEKEYLISLQSLANYCKGGNKRLLNSVLNQDHRNKLCDIFFNDLIIKKLIF
ncbi:hypothetical protein TUBRATIS_20550 [Tubulinosema ratisbonensis]|uniref:Uncharacterized protein n=1 Tax=Tubulinosema ratisbonensis TaxID=291195 RepID=A0A437AK86_9MICR|nr:hypothetical protein TUBRATIS_20550 [Tubulinosema ratisbonensis]